MRRTMRQETIVAVSDDLVVSLSSPAARTGSQRCPGAAVLALRRLIPALCQCSMLSKNDLERDDFR